MPITDNRAYPLMDEYNRIQKWKDEHPWEHVREWENELQDVGDLLSKQQRQRVRIRIPVSSTTNYTDPRLIPKE